MLPRENFEILVARIALLAISSSKTNYHIKLASHYDIMDKNHNVVTVNLVPHIGQERHFLNRKMDRLTGLARKDSSYLNIHSINSV